MSFQLGSFCKCGLKPLIFVSFDGEKYSASCPKCEHNNELTPDEIKAYLKRTEMCDVCNQDYYHEQIYEFGRFMGPHRGYYKDQFSELNPHQQREPLQMCEKCLEAIGYRTLPQFIYCDLCHSEHPRIFGSDTQGDGLCGTVCKVGQHQGYIGWAACRDQQVQETYIVDCGYGSGYDSVGEYDMTFKNNTLPDNIKLGMEICDECITTMLAEGVLEKPAIYQ